MISEIAHDAYVNMLPRLDDFVGSEPLNAEVVSDDPFLPFLPPELVQQGVCKTLYLGYRTAFHAIRAMLTVSDTAPTANTLHMELAEGVRKGRYNHFAVERFLEKGGEVKHALDYAIHEALWTSPTPIGDGSFDQKWDAPLPFPDSRLSSPQRLPQTPSSPQSKSVGSPLLRSPESGGASPRPSSRRRSNSFKDMFFGRRERSLSLIQIKEDDTWNHALQWGLKDEWDASGTPGCPLDMQFQGVRYCLGLHTTPRWSLPDIELQETGSPGKCGCEMRGRDSKA